MELDAHEMDADEVVDDFLRQIHNEDISLEVAEELEGHRRRLSLGQSTENRDENSETVGIEETLFLNPAEANSPQLNEVNIHPALPEEEIGVVVQLPEAANNQRDPEVLHDIGNVVPAVNVNDQQNKKKKKIRRAGNKAKCVSCLRRKNVQLLRPCRHRLCIFCANEWFKMRRPTGMTCPYCTGLVESWLPRAMMPDLNAPLAMENNEIIVIN